MSRIRDVFWLSVAKLGALIMQVAAVRVYFRSLGDEGYGVLVYFTTVMGYVILVDVGLISALQREVLDRWAKGRVEEIAGLSRVAAKYVAIAYLFGVVLYGVLMVALPFPFLGVHSGDLRPFAAFASLHLAGNLAFLFFTSLLSGVSEFRRLSIATGVSGILVPALGMGAVALFHTQESVIAGTALGFLVSAILSAFLSRTWWMRQNAQPLDERQVRKELFGVGLRSYAAKLAAQFSTSIDRLIIANVQSGLLTGYALCFQIAQTFQEMLIPAYQTMFPTVSRAVVNGEPDRAETLEKHTFAGVALASSFTLVCCGYADPLIRVWIGTTILGSIETTLWLGVFKCFELGTNILGIAHFAMGRMERLVPISVANAALTAVLTPFALHQFGIAGVGAMNAALSFCLMFPLLQSVRRHAAPGMRRGRFMSQCLAIVAVGGAFATLVAWIGTRFTSTWASAAWLMTAPIAILICFFVQVKVLRVPLPSRLTERLPRLAKLFGVEAAPETPKPGDPDP